MDSVSQSKSHQISVHGVVSFGDNKRVVAHVVVELGELDHLSQYDAREEIRRRLRESITPYFTEIHHVDTIDALLAERRQR